MPFQRHTVTDPYTATYLHADCYAEQHSDGYTDPVYRWEEPTVAPDGKDSATVSVKLTMSTSDEKTAKQDLKFTVIRKTGWLVCDVAG